MQCDGPQKQVILNSVKNKLSKSAIVILLMLVTHQRHTGTCFNRYISDTLSLVAVDFDTQEPNRQHCHRPWRSKSRVCQLWASVLQSLTFQIRECESIVVIPVLQHQTISHQSLPHCPEFASHVCQQHQWCLLIITDIELTYLPQNLTFFFSFFTSTQQM